MIDATKAELLSELVLETFRLNGRLIAAGDALVAGIGLTSARWQVIGAITLQPEPTPVAHVAQAMGLARQSVQRIADELEKAGLVAFRPNPRHKRAHLVALTAKGIALSEAAMDRQRPWAKALAAGFDRAELEAALDLFARLRARLEDISQKEKDT
jgi:DNA-binding MarR family transcriptional regulator